MFSKLFDYLFSLEQTIEHDVEQIISSFTDTVTKLEAAAVAKVKEAEAHTQLSIDAEYLADAAFSAAEKATAVAGKIKALVA